MTTAFAHPVEAELARLFDQHGVAWQYEPHTFVLERDVGGNVAEAFTPDFFLPELGIYVECTVMKQSLTRRKRTKARRASRLHRDFERLARRWSLPQLASAARSTDAFEVSGFRQEGIPAGEMGDVPATRADRLFHIDVERVSNGTAVVAVEGDVDLHSGPALRDELARLRTEGARRVVVDLTDATFLDSMALGVLLGAKRDLAGADGTLELVVTSDDIRRIFEITMLEKIFVLHESRESAIRAGES